MLLQFNPRGKNTKKKETNENDENLKAQMITVNDSHNKLVERHDELVDRKKEINDKMERMEIKEEETCAQLIERVGCMKVLEAEI